MRDTHGWSRGTSCCINCKTTRTTRARDGTKRTAYCSRCWAAIRDFRGINEADVLRQIVSPPFGMDTFLEACREEMNRRLAHVASIEARIRGDAQVDPLDVEICFWTLRTIPGIRRDMHHGLRHTHRHELEQVFDQAQLRVVYEWLTDLVYWHYPFHKRSILWTVWREQIEEKEKRQRRAKDP